MTLKISASAHTVPLVVAAVMLIGMFAALQAQRASRPGVETQGKPIATNTILENPGAYYGKQVTISAGVDQMVSKIAFLIDQWKAVGPKEVKPIGKPILVIAPYLTAAFGQRNYLTVRGEIVKLDPATIARLTNEYKLDLAPELSAQYRGQPVLLASSVITSTYAEVAWKPVPPPTATEVAMGMTMKTISATFADLRTAAQESKTAVVTQNAAKLLPAFSQIETAFDDVGQSAAAQWARDARTHATSIEQGAAAGNWDAVKTSAVALNQLCASCHGAYRDRADDGTFRIKPGLF